MLQTRMEEVKAQVEAALDAAMNDLPLGELTDAMRYACLGGKKLRAFLVMESARLHGVPDSAALTSSAVCSLNHRVNNPVRASRWV